MASLLALAGCALAVVSCRVAAQSVRSCPPVVPGEPYLACQVDRPPLADPQNVAPGYPAMLLQARVAAVLRVRFVVDTTGRVRRGSLEVVDPAHDLFTQAVKNVLGRWAFDPATNAGRPVPARYEQIFEFSLPKDSEVPTMDVVVLARDTTAEGVARLVIGNRERDVDAASHFTEQDLLDAQRSALLTLAPAPVTDSTGRPRVTVCLTLRGDPVRVADTATLRALTQPGRRAVVPRDCPRTYVSMVYHPARRPPPGWIDPYYMTVTRLEPWSSTIALVNVDVSQGTGTSFYRCVVTRDGSSWRAACRHHGSMVS